MSDQNTAEPEVQTVYEMLEAEPGTLTTGYLAGLITNNNVMNAAEKDHDAIEKTIDYADSLVDVFKALGFDWNDENRAEQLDAVGIALETLAYSRNPFAMLANPSQLAQDGFIVGLLTGLAIAQGTDIPDALERTE